jgi:hypothetical protein
MPGAKKNFIGLEGFIWWIGIVEDRNDPEKLGRVRVRCFGWHTEKKEKIPTDALPWAHPVIPINNPNSYTPKEGDMVFGFFIDGDSAQNPAIMGVLPGKPDKKPNYQTGFSDPGTTVSSRPKKPNDAEEQYPKSKYLKEPTTNRLGRGKPEGTIIETRKKNLKKGVKSAGGVSWSEPAPAYATKYPYNNVLETESGHALEFDDTPGKERIHWAHRNGSFIEIDSAGNRVERVQKDNYTVIMGSDYIYIKGKASITVDGDFNMKTSTINIEAKAINMAADGDVRIKGRSVKIESTGGMDLKAGGSGNFTSGGKLSLKGATAALAGATVDIPAGKIGLQSGSASSASGTGLKGGGSTPSAEEMSEAANSAANVASGGVASESLDEVAITSKKIPVPDGSKIGKVLEGVTSTVSNVFTEVKNTAEGLLKDFAANIPLGELADKTFSFEGMINDSKGSILGLKDDLKNTLLNKIDQVATEAINRNIDFNPDSDIQNAIASTAVRAVENKLAKRVYPKTESYKEETGEE